MQDVILIHEKDNVAVALRTLKAGTEVRAGGYAVTLTEDILQGHKLAVAEIHCGTEVVKYGYKIGTATRDIKPGSWVHVHNTETGLGELVEYSYQPVCSEQPVRSDQPVCSEQPVCSDQLVSSEQPVRSDQPVSSEPDLTEEAFFMGYRRENGKIGVRNELWIIPTVGCVNNVAEAIEKKARQKLSGSVEAVAAFTHPYGCSQMGEDQENTKRILAALVNHPNAGGILVLGLGCENCSIDEIRKYIGPYNPERVKFLCAQDCEDEIEEGYRLIMELADYAGSFTREKISAKELVVGLKCGGSDGLSGITANPSVGKFSDLLIAMGGTAILTEVPEMFGAETILMNRCGDEELFGKTVALINDFKNYYKSHNQTIYENPSPGNKKGGITTLEDKSLGCTQKSGTAPVRGVLSYGEGVRVKGLNLLSAPGNDLVSSTALAASGAHIILFTTGRGTPFASPVPTIKISSNSQLYEKKRNWIDFNAGQVLESGSTADMGRELFDLVMAVASGKKVKSEEAGYHGMAIFKQGVTL